MNTTRAKIVAHRAADRLRFWPPRYKRVGGIGAVVTRADGRVEDLGTVSDVYARRWAAGASTKETT